MPAKISSDAPLGGSSEADERVIEEKARRPCNPVALRKRLAFSVGERHLVDLEDELIGQLGQESLERFTRMAVRLRQDDEFGHVP